MLVLRVRSAVPFVAGLTLAGLALSAQEKPYDRTRGATVHTVIIKPQTRFSSSTLQRMLVGLPGAPSRAGADMLERFGIQDPALRLRERFVAGLGDVPGKVVPLESGPRDDDAKALAKSVSDGFVLDFRTRIWKTIPFSMDTKHHKIEYWGRARLVSVPDGAVIWDETCKYMGDAPKGQRPTMEDMVANDGALLKSSLDAASDHCASALLLKFGAPKGSA